MIKFKNYINKFIQKENGDQLIQYAGILLLAVIGLGLIFWIFEDYIVGFFNNLTSAFDSLGTPSVGTGSPTPNLPTTSGDPLTPPV